MTSMDIDDDVAIDTNLYSRQLYVVGAEAQKKMLSTNFLIVGMSGLGCEVAKNVILTGAKSVSLLDPSPVSSSDLSSHFYLLESDVGKNRVDACQKRLQELNANVKVSQVSGSLTDANFLAAFNVVIIVDHMSTTLAETNIICRSKGIKFITAESRGLCGMIFVDNGDEFTVFDHDGEEPASALVTSVTNSAIATITVHDEARHGLQNEDVVMFTDIEGLDELNSAPGKQKEFPVTVTGPFTFTIPVDTSGSPRYSRGGYVKQVKKPRTMNFLPLTQSLAMPDLMITDFGKMEHPQQMHLFFQALHQFMAKSGGIPPAAKDAAAAQQIVAIAEQMKTQYVDFPEVNKEFIATLAMNAVGNLSPMAAFIGGFAAQEALKACTGKFTPIHQWFYMDCAEVLPEVVPSAADCVPMGSRYDGQIAIFGKEYQAMLGDSSVFVVGAGALGCEFLKNFAMMGLGCGKGKVTVTDMDNIEKSNLSRQFLFRTQHIGQQKSECAAAAAKVINPSLNVTTMCDKVGPDTEHLFNDCFWERNVDIVVNALDNVQARLYVDTRCVYYRKPLLESGTLGTKGNVQVVVPHLTESYGSSRDPPEKSVPICTLKHFPNSIEHCIQAARDSFEGLFKQSPEDCVSYITRDDFVSALERDPATKQQTLENTYDGLVRSRPANLEDCVQWGRLRFEELFNNSIQQLLFNFPLDTITASGERFWSGPKRPPTPQKFDAGDVTHVDFVHAAAMLRAATYSIAADALTREIVIAVASQMSPPPFVARKTAIQVEDSKPLKEDEKEKPALTADELIGALPPRDSLKGCGIQPLEFEKDNDHNFHVAFITACSNLRARNYKIPEESFERTKQIAGRIIPAMITTTALVTGLVSMEMYKLLSKKTKLDQYKNAFVNVALPFIAFSDPIAAPSTTYGAGESWTLWDRFDLDFTRDITLQEFIDFFMKEHKLEVSMVSCGSSILCSFFSDKRKLADRLKKPLSAVVEEVTKQPMPKDQHFINLEICCSYEEEDVEVPYVRYRFRW